jgi:trehalose 6-phosphate synthase/phosphatase
MAQVIIVSNRLPVSVKKEDGKLTFQPSLGGLATGLASYVNKRNNRWIGWPGIPSDDLTEHDRQEIVTELAVHNCSPVFLTKKQIDEYYNGYSNDVLWPLFHELPIDDNAEQQERWWKAYRSVNKAFAEAVIGLLGADSRIWIHDYQLLLLPTMLREEDIAGSIGFFLHIPFPPAAAFQKQPEFKKLLQGMLGADLIGFHTTSYVDNFLENCVSLPKTTVQSNKILCDNRTVRVGNFPMGIDYSKFAAAAEARKVKDATSRFRKRYKGLKVIAAVDRLDPSKGLLERMKAYCKLLEQNPKLRGKVVFSLIAAPSRTDIPAYKRLSQNLDTLVKEINRTYGSKRWQPVDYINTAQPFEEVAALFSVADVAFIAPIKDGMNLAAKEFVASKRRGGVLVLSETAGAAEELRDALLVNPARPATLVEGLQKALDMPKKELRSRMLTMQAHLAANNVHNWAKTFVDTLQKPVPGTPTYTRSVQGKVEAKMLADYRKAKKRLLLLDYDGTLAPFSRNYSDVKPPKQVLQILDLLDNDDRNDVVVISGRHADDLKTWFGRLRINLVAEHGAMIKKAGSRDWHVMTRSEAKWKRAIEPMLEKYTDLTPGAQLEYKAHSLVWHYRGVPAYYAQKYSVIIKKVLKPLVKTYGLKIYQGNKILEIKDPRITKGAAAMRWLRHRYDFIIAIGDDYTDEAMFAAAPASSYTIKVGPGRTAAHYRLPSSPAVRKLLTKFTK